MINMKKFIKVVKDLIKIWQYKVTKEDMLEIFEKSDKNKNGTLEIADIVAYIIDKKLK